MQRSGIDTIKYRIRPETPHGKAKKAEGNITHKKANRSALSQQATTKPQGCGMCDQQSLRSACAYAQSDQSLCWSLKYSMSFELLTDHYLEFLSLKGGRTGSSESTLVKMPHCWKSNAAAQM